MFSFQAYMDLSWNVLGGLGVPITKHVTASTQPITQDLGLSAVCPKEIKLGDRPR